MMLKTGLFVLGLLATPAWAGQLEDLKRDQAMVRLEMEKETAKFQAAQSEIGRIQVVFPQLQAQERELTNKIDALEKKSKKE